MAAGLSTRPARGRIRHRIRLVRTAPAPMVTAGSLMTPNPMVAPPGTPLSELAYRMIQYGCGAIPIVTDLARRELIGIVTDRDIISRAVSADRSPLCVAAEDVMTTNVEAVGPETSLQELYALFRRLKFRRAPVVDRDRRVIGIVTLYDLVQKAPRGQRSEVDRVVREVLRAG